MTEKDYTVVTPWIPKFMMTTVTMIEDIIENKNMSESTKERLQIVIKDRGFYAHRLEFEKERENEIQKKTSHR